MLQRHPDDPFAVNHFLTAVLFRELYRMGALNTGEYANDSFIRAAHRPADPKVKQQIKDLVQRALQLGGEESERKFQGCGRPLRPRSDARPVRNLYRDGRARLVFGAAKRGGSAPRSRTGARTCSRRHARQS